MLYAMLLGSSTVGLMADELDLIVRHIAATHGPDFAIRTPTGTAVLAAESLFKGFYLHDAEGHAKAGLGEPPAEPLTVGTLTQAVATRSFNGQVTLGYFGPVHSLRVEPEARTVTVGVTEGPYDEPVIHPVDWLYPQLAANRSPD